MDTRKEQTGRKIKLERIFGIILLVPPILGVFMFLLGLLFTNNVGLSNLSVYWNGYAYAGNTGDEFSVGVEGNGFGFTPGLPIYFGLMAIAGAILLKGTDNK